MGVLVFTWQPTRRGSDAGGSGGVRAADITPLQSEKQRARERERKEVTGQENHKWIKGWDRNKETNSRSLSSLLLSTAGLSPCPAVRSTVYKCKHAVKMSQCPRRLGKCTFDYEMCLPSTAYKSSDTGFCLSRALPVPALSQPLGCYPLSSSPWPAALSDWSRLQLSWLREDFHNSFRNGHSTNISSTNAGLPKGRRTDMGRCFLSDSWKAQWAIQQNVKDR